MKGRFIVFEGIDGCGKTTQVKSLQNWLKDSGLLARDKYCLITREPGGTGLGIEIRNILLNNKFDDIPEPLTELLLYAADRAQHVSKIIQPALERGDWVISDRFSGSTIAYQGFGRKLNIELIRKLEIIATQGLKPDVTFLLDLDVNESIKRRMMHQNDRIESEGKDFLHRVAKGFYNLSKERDWIVISAESSPEEISTNIQNQISNHKL
tara:strand:+ start:399 stop:1028 length:630 start_codon:yes stop_codon:yes gene_type:complete